MKKLISVIMMAVMCCAFTACKNDGGANSSNSNSQQQSSTTGSTAAGKTISEKAEELLKEIEFPGMAPQGMEFVEVDLGITPDMVTEYV